MNLFKAHNQWATRPADERFGSLDEMAAACKGYADIAKEYEIKPSDMRLAVAGDQPVLVGQSGRQAEMTHWAFGQLCQRASSPADFMRDLPAEMACDVLNYRMLERAVETENKPVKLLMHVNGGMLLRACTGMGYQRYWNWKVCEGLKSLQDGGWRVPAARPALEGQPGARIATAGDCGPSSLIREGELIAPAGLYASDHDMFAFMVNEEFAVASPTRPDSPLYRGFFVEHSEVGDASFTVYLFFYEQVCGNHIVWNAANVREIRIPHKGKAIERIDDQLEVKLIEYAGQTAMYDEQRLGELASKELGGNKAEVCDLLFTKRLLSYSLAERAYDACEQEQTPIDGSNPRSPWGIVQGLTRLSQLSAYADQRNTIDRQAGKILEVF